MISDEGDQAYHKIDNALNKLQTLRNIMLPMKKQWVVKLEKKVVQIEENVKTKADEEEPPRKTSVYLQFQQIVKNSTNSAHHGRKLRRSVGSNNGDKTDNNNKNNNKQQRPSTRAQ